MTTPYCDLPLHEVSTIYDFGGSDGSENFQENLDMELISLQVEEQSEGDPSYHDKRVGIAPVHTGTQPAFGRNVQDELQDRRKMQTVRQKIQAFFK